MSDDENTFLSGWNTAQGLIMEVVRLKSRANALFTAGELDYAISNLIAIKQTICSVLEPVELTALNEIEEDFFQTRFTLQTYEVGFRKHDEKWIEEKKKIQRFYDTYNQQLMNALQKHDLLLSEKIDTTKMKI